MLGLFNSAAKHPLADLRESRRVLDGLARGEARASVVEAGGWMEGLRAADGFAPDAYLALIIELDDATAAQARRLGREYLAACATDRTLELQLFDAAYGYWQRVTDAYLHVIDLYRNGARGAPALKPQLPMVYGRLLKALAARLKWDQYRYTHPDGAFWSVLGDVYLAAENAGCAQQRRYLYSGGPETSIEAEYLKVLVFHASAVGNLSPAGIELAERLIEHFAPVFSMTAEVSPENIYWVDAALPEPPCRLARLPEMTDTLRFFNCVLARDAALATISRIRDERRVPPDINLGAVHEPATVLPVLEHLVSHWSLQPPVRSLARRRVSATVHVVHGLQKSIRMLRGMEDDGAAAWQDRETWELEDVSEGGVSALVKLGRNDWIRIGALVLGRMDELDVGKVRAEGIPVALCVVRRYVRSGSNRSKVGIEFLSREPRAVLTNSDGFEAGGIVLDTPRAGQFSRIVLPLEAAEENVPLEFLLDGRPVQMRITAIIERGSEYVVVRAFVEEGL